MDLSVCEYCEYISREPFESKESLELDIWIDKWKRAEERNIVDLFYAKVSSNWQAKLEMKEAMSSISLFFPFLVGRFGEFFPLFF